MTTSAVSVEKLLDLAIHQANAGQRERAKSLCEQADAAHPAHPAVLQLLAVFSLQDGDFARARRHASASLALRPDHVPTLVVAADAARAVDAFEEALTYYARAHGLQSERVDIGLSLGALQHRRGLLHPALKTLEHVARLVPDQADVWFQLALVRQDLRDLDGAALALRRVLQLAPERADAEVNLGIVLQESGHVEQALCAYGRAYRLREDTFGRITHALAAAGVGRLWLNLDELRDVLSIEPE